MTSVSVSQVVGDNDRHFSDE